MTFEVIDTIRNLTDADIAQMKGLGITGVSRYIARTSGIGKIMRRPECDRILASGLALMVNYEQSAGDWQGGAAQGAADGTWARNYVRGTLGLPDSVIIIQSIDTGVSGGQLRVAADYQKAFNDGGGVGPQGVYGPRNVLEHLHGLGLVRVCWEWMGTAGAPSSPVANIRQFRNKPYNLPFTYDANTPITPFYGQYSGTGTIEGDGDLTDAQDKILNAILQRVLTMPDDVWATAFPEADGVAGDTAGHRCNYSAIRIYDSILPQLKALSDKVDSLTVGGVDLALLKQLVRDSVREEIDDTLWQSKPAS